MKMKYSPKALTAIDLFCGAGGLTLGLKQAGFSVLAAVEIDAFACETFRANHPEVICLEQDIQSISPSDLRRKVGLRKGELSLLAGCPPCQGFSTLRTRRKSRSVKDDRNGLLFEFQRFVAEFLPRALMMENVPALAGDARMTRLLRGLKELGYVASDKSVQVLDAADYGVPQRRKRMIMQLARRGTIGESTTVPRITVKQALARASLKDVGHSGDSLHDYIPRRGEKAIQIIKAIPKNGGSRSSLPENLVLACHKRRPNCFRDVYGRMSWDDVAPTMTGGCGNPSKGRFLHPEEDRAISLREAAIFQTFPVDYKFSIRGGRDRVALMIGNALPPEFIRLHALVIADALRFPK